MKRNRKGPPITGQRCMNGIAKVAKLLDCWVANLMLINQELTTTNGHGRVATLR